MIEEGHKYNVTFLENNTYLYYFECTGVEETDTHIAIQDKLRNETYYLLKSNVTSVRPIKRDE